MEDITSAKFRVFLAQKAINYLYLANLEGNILIQSTNIGCPNISFGPGTSTPPLVFLSRIQDIDGRLRVLRVHGDTHTRQNHALL